MQAHQADGYPGFWSMKQLEIFLLPPGCAVLSVRFEGGVSLLQAPTRADKRGSKAPFPLVENEGIQPALGFDSQESTRQNSGGSRVLLKALDVVAVHHCDRVTHSIKFG